MDIEKLKKRCGYDGKPQQWQYGFDLACRELAQAVPEGFVLMPIQPTEEMIKNATCEFYDLDIDDIDDRIVFSHQAMIDAQEQSHD